ncbi:MAG: hypothetical protein ACREU6_02390, partial [Steroidobacteraceae bacterium]
MKCAVPEAIIPAPSSVVTIRARIIQPNSSGHSYAATAALVDGLIFIAALSAGMTMGNAHIASFTVAGLLNYLTNLRPAIAQAGRTLDARLYGHLLAVSLLALFLRGGVLSLLTTVWG